MQGDVRVGQESVGGRAFERGWWDKAEDRGRKREREGFGKFIKIAFLSMRVNVLSTI